MSTIPPASGLGAHAFTSSEVRRITGASTMQINHWDRLGIVKPSLRPAEGTGSRRVYSPDDLAAVAIVLRLRAVNISLECLSTAMPKLRNIWPNFAAISAEAIAMICPDGTCHPVAKETDTAVLPAVHRAAILIDLAGVVDDLRKRHARVVAAEPFTPTAPTSPQASAWGEDW